MESLSSLLGIALLVWTGALAVVVAAGMLRGDIATAGLLTQDGTGAADPERVALLALTVGIALWYVIETITAPARPPGAASLPDMPEEALLLFGGGKGAYLLGKVTRRAGGG